MQQCRHGARCSEFTPTALSDNTTERTEGTERRIDSVVL